MARRNAHVRDAPAGRKGHWPLPAFAVGLTALTRLLFILQAQESTFSTISPHMVDSYFYHRWALEIVQGNFWGSDVFFLRPLYPYLLAILYSVFGPHLLPVQLVQSLLAALSCLLLYDLTRRLFDRRAAAFAAFGYALCGILAFYSGAMLYVELTVLLSLLCLWLVLIAGDRLWLWLAAGAVFGPLVVCRPELLVVLPFLLIWLHRKRTHIRNLAAMTAAAAVVVLAVPVRNHVVARDPVLFTAHSGINFYYGNNPSADGTWQSTDSLDHGPGFSHDRLKRTGRMIEGKQVSWSRASSYWFGRGVRFIISRPVDLSRLLGRKLMLFFSNYEVPNNYYPETVSSPVLRLLFVNFGLALAFGLLGMVRAWPRRARVLPVYLFIAAFLASALAFYVLSRLRAPVIPFLLMFAGFGASELLRQRPGRLVLGLVAVVAAYVTSALIPVRRDAYSAQAWTQAGNIELGRRRMPAAVGHLRRALTAQPSNAAARYSLVMALAGSGRVGEAEAEHSELLRTASDRPTDRLLVQLAEARIAIARRDFELAARLYRSAAAADPDYPETRYLLGLVYVSMDSLDQARDWLQQALLLDPQHADAASTLQAVETRLRH